MPKAAKAAVSWSPQTERYTLQQVDHALDILPTDDQVTWRAWVTTVTAFSFQGQHGRANLLKEQRKGSDVGYWYAYQRQGQRVRKRYVGRDADLSLAHLEAVVETFNPSAPDQPRGPDDASVTKAALGNKPTTTAASAPIAQAATHQLAVLLPKLQAPRLQSDLIARAHLLRQLTGTLTRRLTLVTAPAGFGKTTVVRQWLAAFPGQPAAPAVAWLTLDGADNDPVRFWRYLIEAYRTINGEWGQAALAQLATATQLPFEPLPLETIVTTLLNELSQAPPPTLLILDDYHLITESAIHTTLTFFLEHLPSNMHLMLLARSEPPLPLARWRLGNELIELRVGDLRFSSVETQTFLQQLLALPGLSASDQPAARQIVARLATQLAGWPAGWRLLALALEQAQTLTSVERFVTTFAGSHRPLLTYFVEEVLNRQPAAWQDFLLRISGLERFTASLCSTVTGNAQSGELLDQWTRAGLFLEALDGPAGWHRLHPLFAEAMQHEARRRLGDDTLRHIANQASHWYAAHALPAEAIEMALRAQNYAQAATLIQALNGDRIFMATLQQVSLPIEFHTLLRWLTQFPTEHLHQYPDLCLDYATALLMVHFSEHHSTLVLAEFDAALNAAERGFRTVGDKAKLAEIFAFHALLARHQGQINQAALWAQQAIAWLPAKALAWRSVCFSAIAIGEFFGGSLAVAHSQMQMALEHVRMVDNPHLLRAIAGQLSAIRLEQGELHATAALLRPMLNEARAVGDTDDIGHAQLGLAKVAYQWNQLTAAECAATEAFAVMQQTDNEAFSAEPRLLLAQIAFAQGKHEEALAQLATLFPELPRQHAPRHQERDDEIQRIQAHFALMCGDFAGVERWWRGRHSVTAAPPALYAAREQLLFARWLLAQQRLDEAIGCLTALLTTVQAAQRTQIALEVQVVLAFAYMNRQETAQALDQLRHVVSFTAIQGHLRLFLDEGPALMPLLRALYPSLTDQTQRSHVRQLIHAFAAADPTIKLNAAVDLSEPLSRQEQRVLQALVAGSTNAEIAQTLIVSVNTIRTQLQSIYRKLDVNSRVAAIEMARRLGLLDHPIT